MKNISHIAAGVALIITLATSGGCGALDPTKSNISEASPSQARNGDQKVDAEIVNWRTVLETTANNIKSGIQRIHQPPGYLIYRSIGCVIEADSVYPGTTVNLLEWVTIPGIPRKSVVWAFSFLRESNGWVVVLFDRHGGQLAISSVLSATGSDLNNLDLQWTSSSEGRGGEGENYAKIYTTHRMFRDESGELIVESHERYWTKTLFGLSQKEGYRKSIARFPEIIVRNGKKGSG